MKHEKKRENATPAEDANKYVECLEFNVDDSNELSKNIIKKLNGKNPHQHKKKTMILSKKRIKPVRMQIIKELLNQMDKNQFKKHAGRNKRIRRILRCALRTYP